MRQERRKRTPTAINKAAPYVCSGSDDDRSLAVIPIPETTMFLNIEVHKEVYKEVLLTIFTQINLY